MTPTIRRRDRAAARVRDRASPHQPWGPFTSDRPIPPSTSWWVGVPRAEWSAVIAAHEPRWRRTETSTPTPGV